MKKIQNSYSELTKSWSHCNKLLESYSKQKEKFFFSGDLLIAFLEDLKVSLDNFCKVLKKSTIHKKANNIIMDIENIKGRFVLFSISVDKGFLKELISELNRAKKFVKEHSHNKNSLVKNIHHQINLLNKGMDNVISNYNLLLKKNPQLLKE